MSERMPIVQRIVKKNLKKSDSLLLVLAVSYQRSKALILYQISTLLNKQKLIDNCISRIGFHKKAVIYIPTLRCETCVQLHIPF